MMKYHSKQKITNKKCQNGGAMIIAWSAIWIFFVMFPAFPDIYKYVDENGKQKFVNDVKRVPEKYRNQLNKVVVSAPPEEPESDKKETEGNINDAEENKTESEVDKKSSEAEKKLEQKVEPKRKHKVEIFITSWCPYCKKLESILKQNRIEYTRYDIERDREGRKKYDALKIGGVPVTVVDSQVIPGFAPDEILDAVKK